MGHVVREALGFVGAAVVVFAGVTLLVFVPTPLVWLLVGAALATLGAGLAIVGRPFGRGAALATGAVGSWLAGISVGWALGRYDLLDLLGDGVGAPQAIVLTALIAAGLLVVASSMALGGGRRRILAVVALVFVAVAVVAIIVGQVQGTPSGRYAPLATVGEVLLLLAAWTVLRIREWRTRRPASRRRRQ
ncbi:MAG: hypothetical protein KatS3mg060_0392 [Dehalococcoidia bacterium]|nr:MAG: hypothetical protein KatS3mg060_0392 [Dehalococcoidia bacterium]